MHRDEIVENLAEVNRQLSLSRSNPATIKDGKLQFHGTPEEMKEVVSLIGKWSYEKEMDSKQPLRDDKLSLEKALKDSFD